MKHTLLALSILIATVAAADDTKPAPPADLKTPPATAEKSSTGLLSVKLADGTGVDRPSELDYAKFRYTVWNTDGKLIDYIAAPKVSILPVSRMLPGLREAIETMAVGERRRLWIPETLGAKGRVSAGGMLVIDLELVSIMHAPAVPSDVAAPPEDAIKTRSGLAYRVLRPGTGTVHPKSSSTVRVHYTGWRVDGKMFDSSVVKDQPAEFPLNRVIPGWTEGLQLMTVGERVRFWVPSNLAYRSDPSKPQGMLVFDVELLEIE